MALLASLLNKVEDAVYTDKAKEKKIKGLSDKLKEIKKIELEKLAKLDAESGNSEEYVCD
jgi:hypothetical protein